MLPSLGGLALRERKLVPTAADEPPPPGRLRTVDDELREDKQRLEGRVVEQYAETLRCQDEVARLKRALKAVENARVEAHNAHVAVDQEVRALHARAGDGGRELHRLLMARQRKIDGLDRNVRALEARLKTCNDDIAEAKKGMQALGAAYAKASRDLADCQSSASLARDNRRESRKTMLDAVAAARDYQDQNARLHTQLSEALSELERCKKALSEEQLSPSATADLARCAKLLDRAQKERAEWKRMYEEEKQKEPAAPAAASSAEPPESESDSESESDPDPYGMGEPEYR